MTLTRPHLMTLRDWADCAVLDLSAARIGSLSDDDWQGWAAQLLNNPTLPGALPNPYQFTTWSAWAERLCDALT